ADAVPGPEPGHGAPVLPNQRRAAPGREVPRDRDGAVLDQRRRLLVRLGRPPRAGDGGPRRLGAHPDHERAPAVRGPGRGRPDRRPVIDAEGLPAFPPLPDAAATVPEAASMLRLVQALDTAALEVEDGELHALVVFDGREVIDGYLEHRQAVAIGPE